MPKGKDIGWWSALLLGAFLVAFWQYRAARVPGDAPAAAMHPSVTVPGSATTSIDDPEYESVVSADQYLKDDGEGLALDLDGKRRFYPFQVLVWHGAVNDPALPVLVTYSPLAGTSGVFDPRVDGAVKAFDVTDMLRDSSPIILDRESHAAEAEGQPRIPTAVMTWKAWRTAFPDGLVLARPGGTDHDYTRDPFLEYRKTAALWYPVEPKDPRLPMKERVVGIASAGTAKAFRTSDVGRLLIIEDEVGGLPVLILFDKTRETITAFDRRVLDATLTFTLDDDRGIVDAQSDSVWSARGIATRGSSKGTHLAPIALQPAYWFYWAATHPGTDLWQP
ncbi:DUF3179 domain-containing protein [Patescibacteria group bacterium]|nr:MAG: DUF3179 domain-containing protein [Patescibacteria group bacterium]